MAKPKKGSVALLVGTRKGGFVFRSDAGRRHWSVEGPHIVGQNIHHFILDPRDGETLLAATRSDWWGPDIQRSRFFPSKRWWCKPASCRKAAVLHNRVAFSCCELQLGV